MRKENPVRYSSAVGESWQHCEFKVKYCLFQNARRNIFGTLDCGIQATT